jgi:hypothetical protein
MLQFKMLSSHLFSKNLKIKIYKTIILLVVLYGCLKTGRLKRLSGPRRKWQEAGGDCKMRSYLYGLITVLEESF